MTSHPATTSHELDFDCCPVPPPAGDADPVVKILWASRRLDRIRAAGARLTGIDHGGDNARAQDIVKRTATVLAAQAAAQRVFDGLIAAVKEANLRAQREAKAVDQAIVAGSAGRYLIQHSIIGGPRGAKFRSDEVVMGILGVMAREPYATNARIGEALGQSFWAVRGRISNLLKAGVLTDTRKEAAKVDDAED